ncbi:MAG: hypothetical protein HC853_00985, partial [Anaerolineae bacterium]|nr:hypothetical protein [Anaerolineae bacterium]
MDIFFILVSCLFLLFAFGSTAYLYRLAFASVQSGSIRPRAIPSHRFAIAIPAHNEDAVIADTVARLRQLDYPAHLFDVHIVADH